LLETIVVAVRLRFLGRFRFLQVRCFVEPRGSTNYLTCYLLAILQKQRSKIPIPDIF